MPVPAILFEPTVTLYRLDGVFISNFIGPTFSLDVQNGERKEFQAVISPLNLGAGHYVFSAAIYEKTITVQTRYDLIARMYEFQVVGGEPPFDKRSIQTPRFIVEGLNMPLDHTRTDRQGNA
jgi:hypothetical protein